MEGSIYSPFKKKRVADWRSVITAGTGSFFLKFVQFAIDINIVKGYTSGRELKSSLLCALTL